MTKKLESLFDLPESENKRNFEFREDNAIEETTMVTQVLELSNLEKIENALVAVRGLEASDQEMDDLAKHAVESYKDLMDLGMNVEARHASEIFGVAERMLNNAITAKNAKVNKKLKMIDLQLKKAKLDIDNPVGSAGLHSSGSMLDRNELLDRIINVIADNDEHTPKD